MKRLYFGVGLVTFATLLLELLLTRIFSVTLYYHFAFLVISIALFGLGIAGVMLYLKPERFPEERLRELLSRYTALFAISSVVALAYVLNHSVSTSLDPMRSSYFSWQNFFELGFLYLFSVVPFYFGGMVVTLALYHLREQAATVYFFDLVGASLACLLVDPVLRLLGAPNGVLLACVIIAFAGLLFDNTGAAVHRRKMVWLAVGMIALFMVNLSVGALDVATFKWTKKEHVVFSKWNAFSYIEVQARPGKSNDMTIDGLARTQLYSMHREYKDHPETGVNALVHTVRSSGKMLIIGPGGGIDVMSALKNGHKNVTLAELNPIILNDVMRGQFAEYTGNLYNRPEVHPNIAEGRHFVRHSDQRFDVIQATLVDTWAATASGAFSLSENHLYTVEAFEDYITHLSPTGVLTMSRWIGVPGMEFVRLAALARTALTRLKVENPAAHTFAATHGPLGTLLVKRTPFTAEELARLINICKQRKFKVLHAPGVKANNPIWHALANPNAEKMFEQLPVDVRPVYDDRPFFFYAVKPERFFRDILNWQQLDFNSFALQVLVASFALVMLLVLGAIVIPLWLTRRGQLAGNRSAKMLDLAYFCSLGIGFILIEIGLLQQFTLHLGHPIHSLRVVFFGMLFFGGVGSLLSGRVRSQQGIVKLQRIAVAVTVCLGVLYSVILGPVLHHAIAWSFGLRVAFTVALVALPAMAMGMLLPSGLRLVATRYPEMSAWAWGLNGATSVLGSVLAMIVAINLGFQAVLIGGAFTYALAFVCALVVPRLVAAKDGA